MNPDKLFDYLDGKLSSSERAKMEELFMSDPEARRELAVARQIHASMTDSREIVGIADPTSTSDRGPVLARRIMVVFMVLVFANVAFGIYAIFFMKDRQRARERTEQNRSELTQSLSKTAAAALPTPTLGVEEIEFTTPVAEQNAFADTIIDEAKHAGGSAVKGLADEHGILLFAEIPTARLNEFREAMKKLGGTVPPAAEAGSGEKAILQVRLHTPQ
jgi:hypothetical protein